AHSLDGRARARRAASQDWDTLQVVERRGAGGRPGDSGRRDRSGGRSLRVPHRRGVVTGSLFEEPESPFRRNLADSLSRLAREGIFIGTSSWKYEGWLGQIYSRSNYMSRGRFSKRAFEAECLREYAGIFPTVCGDFAFHQFPNDEFLLLLF